MASVDISRLVALQAFAFALASVPALAYAAGKTGTGTFTWVNNTAVEYRVDINSYNSCVTDRGPSSFTVSPRTRYNMTIKIQPLCPDKSLSIQWRLTQKDMSGNAHVTDVGYYENFEQPSYPWTAKAYLSISGDKLPVVNLFRANCGENYLTCGRDYYAANNVNVTRALIAAIPVAAALVGEGFGIRQ